VMYPSLRPLNKPNFNMAAIHDNVLNMSAIYSIKCGDFLNT
jgi:hypothetical protein